jgi:transcriptional regulator with XRE-family HTH domain
MNSFGDFLRERRCARGLSLRKTAEKVGVQSSYLSKVERGIKPPPSAQTIVKLAHVLDEDPGALLLLAGKIPDDYCDVINLSPQSIAELLRCAADASIKDIRYSAAELRDKWEDVDAWSNAVNFKTASLLQELHYCADLNSTDSLDDLLGISHAEEDRLKLQKYAEEQLLDILQMVSHVCSELVLGGNVSIARSLPDVINRLSFASRRFNTGRADLLDTAHSKTARINLFVEYLYQGYIWNSGQRHPCPWLTGTDRPADSGWETWQPLIRNVLEKFTEGDPGKLTVFKHVLEYKYPQGKDEPPITARDEQTGKLRLALLKDAPADKIWNRIMDRIHEAWKNMENKQSRFLNTASS